MSDTRKKHDIWLEILYYDNDEYSSTATVDVSTYPDGSPKNSLSPDELREVAEWLNEAADDMEGELSDG